MPGIECNFFYDRIVLWPATGSFDDYGQPTYGPPVEIGGTWMTQRSQALAKDSANISLDASADVDRQVPMRSKMWKGTLKQWNALGNPNDKELMEVKSYKDNTDAKGRFAARSVGLMRLNNAG